MAEEITPPDLIGAGVASPQQGAPDASSLMAQLRQPAMPPEMGPLMSMPRQTPGQAYAQAAAGGVSAMTGAPNPVMQQQQAQQQQAMQYSQLHERVMNRREKDAEGLLNISKDFLQSDSEEARMVGARGIMNFAKSKGMPIDNFEGMVKSLATKAVSGKELADVFQEIGLGFSPDIITKRHPNLPPDILQQAIQNKDNDPARKLMGLPSVLDERKKIADTKLSEAAALDAESGLKGLPPELKLTVDRIHRGLNAEKSYGEGTTQSQAQAFELAKLQMIDAEQKKAAVDDARKLALEGQLIGMREGAASRLQGQRDIAAEERARIKSETDLAKKTTLADEKRKQAVVVAKTFMNQFLDKIDKLDKEGFLPKDSGVYEHQRAAIKQGKVLIPGVSQPNADTWREWLELQGNMIGFARSVQNDIGPRAMAAFQQAVNVSEKPPTKTGLLNIHKQMMEQLNASESGIPGGPLGSSETRRIRVRDNKTGKVHDAELGAGDMVPLGYTEIK